MDKILLAGATGYLGRYMLKELLRRGFETKALVRNEKKLPQGCLAHPKLDIIKAEVTRPETLKGCCWDVDIVISTVGITRQKDGLTYMDVDYQANLNLLEEAKRNGVRKFVYISVLNADKLTHLKICAAKEKFVAALKKSGLDYCIVRPTGYFSDMAEFYEMARKGRVFLFGDGAHQMNPIHGADLAAICVNAIRSDEKEILAGGPQILTHNQIAETAFLVALKKPKITHIPDWFSKFALFLVRTFTGSKTYGPIEFFMAVLTMDMIAPACGNHRLKEYFEALQ